MDSTPHCSRVVPHPSTKRAQTALTSVFGWEPVDYGWYGRIRQTWLHLSYSYHHQGIPTSTALTSHYTSFLSQLTLTHTYLPCHDWSNCDLGWYWKDLDPSDWWWSRGSLSTHPYWPPYMTITDQVTSCNTSCVTTDTHTRLSTVPWLVWLWPRMILEGSGSKWQVMGTWNHVNTSIWPPYMFWLVHGQERVNTNYG